jgi:hypothetical protein
MLCATGIQYHRQAWHVRRFPTTTSFRTTPCVVERACVNIKQGVKLKPDVFYNDALSERTDLEQEFRRWTDQGDQVFTVCQFPFLLNPEAKRRLLRAEAHQV